MSAPQKKSNKSTSGSAKNKSNANNGPQKLMSKQPSVSTGQFKEPLKTRAPKSSSSSSSTARHQTQSAAIEETQGHQLDIEVNRSSTLTPTAEKPIRSADEKQKQADNAEVPQGLTLSHLYHQRFVFDQYWSEYNKSTTDAGDKRSRENTFREVITVLQAKIKQGSKELESVPQIWDLFQMAVENVEEKLRCCEDLEKQLSDDYSMMLNVLKEHVEAIEVILNRTKEVHVETMERENSFEKENQFQEQKLDKISTEIDFVNKTRDDICLQIAQMDKTLSTINPMIDNFRQSNSQLKDEISVVTHKFTNEGSAMTNITKNAQDWLTEKIEAVDKLKQEKAKLKKEKVKLFSAVRNAKIDYKNLCAKVTELKIDADKQHNLVKRIQNANKNLREDKTSDLQFNEKRQKLIEKIKNVTDNTVALQEETDRRQRQYDDLKRIQEEIAKKKQLRSELQQKMSKVKNDKWKQDHKILITQQYINESKSRRDQSVAKRARFTDEMKAMTQLNTSGSRRDSHSLASKDFRDTDE